MFWTLLLCHLIADYPLQTDAMVQAKKRLPGLTFHVGVHLATLLVIVWSVHGLSWRTTLPAVSAVTVLHFAIDIWKNVLSKRRPQWVIGGYLQDQLLHLLSLFVVVYWLTPGDRFAVPDVWVLYLSGYVLVTHAWFVTERVLTYRNKARQQLVNAQLWPRMASRALMLTLLLWGWRQLAPTGLAAAWFLSWPYGTREEWPWFWIIDIAVAGAVMLLLVTVQ